MNRTLAVGVVAALAGLAVVFVPALAGGIPVTYTTVLVVAILALLFGVLLVRNRLASTRNTATLPDVESKPPHPTPGDEFDEQLADLSPRRDRANEAARAAIRERLETTALAVLSRRGHPRDRALDMLDSGEWTDDPMAASFFATDGAVVDEPVRKRLQRSAAGSSSFERRARRAALAIATLEASDE